MNELLENLLMEEWAHQSLPRSKERDMTPRTEALHQLQAINESLAGKKAAEDAERLRLVALQEEGWKAVPVPVPGEEGLPPPLLYWRHAVAGDPSSVEFQEPLDPRIAAHYEERLVPQRMLQLKDSPRPQLPRPHNVCIQSGFDFPVRASFTWAAGQLTVTVAPAPAGEEGDATTTLSEEARLRAWLGAIRERHMKGFAAYEMAQAALAGVEHRPGFHNYATEHLTGNAPAPPAPSTPPPGYEHPTE